MIRVELRPEPTDFDERVRQPGRRALADDRDPLPAYWRRCLDDAAAGALDRVQDRLDLARIG